MSTTERNVSCHFADLFEKINEEKQSLKNVVKKGTIVKIDGDYAIVDVGLKSEGRIELAQIRACLGGKDPEIGDHLDVFVDHYENKSGEIVLSVDKALKEANWQSLEEMQKNRSIVEGVITNKVKGGFIVDLGSTTAFLPGSQVDLRPIKEKEADALLETKHRFIILSMDKIRGNIVVSKRAILEEEGAEGRAQALAKIEEGQELDGIVKNITPYGAFVDIGGIDGLLHNSDVSWKRIANAADVLEPGQKIKVKVIKFNKENRRISLGIKQLEEDPWKDIEKDINVGERITGVVTNVTDYGIFVEIKNGVEGLVYVSETSWKRNVSPHKIAKAQDNIDVKVLEIDHDKRRIGLSIKQLQDNPFDELCQRHPVGSTVEASITNIAEFGIFLKLTDTIDGLVHLNDIAWGGNIAAEIAKYNKGDVIQAQVLDIDIEKERVSLGIKQLSENPYKNSDVNISKGAIVTCVVDEIQPDGLVTTLANGMQGFIKKAELAKDRQDRNTDRFAVGEKIDAKIISIEGPGKKVNLSIKALEIEEEKQFLAEYGSSDSGASLGDILGSSLDFTKK